MKTWKLVSGILSIVLFFIVGLQSCFCPVELFRLQHERAEKVVILLLSSSTDLVLFSASR